LLSPDLKSWGDIAENVLPFLTVAKPADESAHWDYEIAYAVQDPDKSRRVVIAQDPLIGRHGIVARCLGGRERDLLSVVDAGNIIDDLDRQIDLLEISSLAA
jgi:hypothetical protein